MITVNFDAKIKTGVNLLQERVSLKVGLERDNEKGAEVLI